LPEIQPLTYIFKTQMRVMRVEWCLLLGI